MTATMHCRYRSSDSFLQRTQGNRGGKDEVEGKELFPVRLLPVKQKSSVKEMMVDIEDIEEKAAARDPYWAISRAAPC